MTDKELRTELDMLKLELALLRSKVKQLELKLKPKVEHDQTNF